MSRIPHRVSCTRAPPPPVLVAEDRKAQDVSVDVVGCEKRTPEVTGLGIPRKSLCFSRRRAYHGMRLDYTMARLHSMGVRTIATIASQLRPVNSSKQ